MRPGKDRKPKFIKPKNTFKEKVGSGGLAPELVDKGQKLIEKNDNFEPHAKVYLERISSTLSLHEHHDLIGSEARVLLINPVMQLKGNAGLSAGIFLGIVGFELRAEISYHLKAPFLIATGSNAKPTIAVTWPKEGATVTAGGLLPPPLDATAMDAEDGALPVTWEDKTDHTTVTGNGPLRLPLTLSLIHI